MNARDFKPIFKELLPHLPGFAAHKRLLLMTPMNGILRGVYFDASAFSKDLFDVETFIMPLCVPIEYLVFLFSFSVRHQTRGLCWKRTIPNLADGRRFRTAK